MYPDQTKSRPTIAHKKIKTSPAAVACQSNLVIKNRKQATREHYNMISSIT